MPSSKIESFISAPYQSIYGVKTIGPTTIYYNLHHECTVRDVSHIWIRTLTATHTRAWI